MIIKGRHAVPATDKETIFTGEVTPRGVIRVDDENHPDAWMEITLDGEETWDLVLQTAHRYCSHNRELIEASEWFGCFYCISFHRPKDIKEWIDDGHTAKCPQCGIDAVIPDKSGFLLGDFGAGDKVAPGMGWAMIFLSHMQERWFNRSVSAKDAKKLQRGCPKDA